MILNNFLNLQKLSKQAYLKAQALNTSDTTEVLQIKDVNGTTYNFGDRAYNGTYRVDNVSGTVYGVGTESELNLYLNGIKNVSMYNLDIMPTSLNYGACIFFSDSNTNAATVNDFKLNGNFIRLYANSTSTVDQTMPSLSFVSVTFDVDITTGNRTIYYNYINNSPFTVTVGDWGLFSGSTSLSKPVMLTHDVLTTPLSIPTGGGIRLSFTIRG